MNVEKNDEAEIATSFFSLPSLLLTLHPARPVAIREETNRDISLSSISGTDHTESTYDVAIAE